VVGSGEVEVGWSRYLLEAPLSNEAGGVSGAALGIIVKI
jgi:hypothetical protein